MNNQSIIFHGYDRYNIPEYFIKRIKEVEKKQLQELDLSQKFCEPSYKDLNIIPIIFIGIFELSYLKILILSQNNIRKIPSEIEKLYQLKKIYLGNNQLTSLPESIGNLSNLVQLNLGNNQLTSLPESIGNLSNLVQLNLGNNQLTSLPESIGNLSNLVQLNLGNNQLTSLPESIGNLSNLTSLRLRNNQLTSLPESIGNLSELILLSLSDNRLELLPKNIVKLSKLLGLFLEGNNLTMPPPEIIEKGLNTIREYLIQIIREGEDYIYEAKLLIIGEPGAGKTSLARKIQDSQYQLQEDLPSTEGIDVFKWNFPLDNGREFKINIWDFGGQEIYHTTHQFFLTKRSLYTLVADSRKEDTDFDYWLNVVELLSDNSPLLIIKNEKQERQREINERALRGQFTNLKETLATNLKTNRGLEEILTNVKHYIQNLPHIGDTLPTTWVRVREFLEKDERNYISLPEYLDICEDNGFTQLKDKLQLGEYLHDLGVCLHFQDEEDSLLYKTVILKPEWGTDAVYKVLDNKQVVKNQGCFNRDDLKNIWKESKYASMHGELLELMRKFKLCYKISSSKDTFIAPQLLSDNQPEYDWDESNSLILRYSYPNFMPKGIISRFIVVMHQYIDQQEYVWKSGAILDKDDTKAEIIEYYGKRELIIRVAGINKRDLMTIVTYEIDSINNTYKRLKYKKLIPCNCKVCKANQNCHFYKLEVLKSFIEKEQEKIQCQESCEMVNVQNLIDDVINWNEQERDSSSHGHSDQQANTIINNYGKSTNMTNNRNIKAETYNEQSGKFGIGNINGGEIKGNAKVAAEINEVEKKNLTDAAKEIQQLLEQLSDTYPTTTIKEKNIVVGEVVEQIENHPTLKAKVINALKAGGTEALKEAINHPLVNILVASIEGWQQQE